MVRSRSIDICFSTQQRIAITFLFWDEFREGATPTSRTAQLNCALSIRVTCALPDMYRQEEYNGCFTNPALPLLAFCRSVLCTARYDIETSVVMQIGSFLYLQFLSGKLASHKCPLPKYVGTNACGCLTRHSCVQHCCVSALVL